MSDGEVQPGQWRVLREDPVFAAPPWLALSRQAVGLPDGRTIDDYYQMQLPDFVVAVVTVPDGRVVVLRQYKHGLGRVSLTLPGGMVEAGEAPRLAVEREVREETGYAASGWRQVGSYTVNGNLGCGQGHFFAATSGEKISDASSGDLEQMEVMLLQPSDLIAAVTDGRVGLLNHAAAISLVLGTDFA